MSLTVLAIDTCMAACSAAVWRDGILARRFEAMERGHAERIAPMVREVMLEAGLGFDKLDRIAVTVGPGAFTGQRIGLAMARGLGLALKVPVIGITTLETIASAHASSDRSIVVACDARREEIYFAAFTPKLEPVHAVCVRPLADVLQRLPAGATVVAGSAADTLIAASGRRDLERAHAGDVPDAAHLARLAATRPVPDAPPEPLYLRPPDAKPQAARKAAIRRAGRDDAPKLAALHATCFDEPWDAAAIASILATAGAAAWIAEEGSREVGFALARRVADEVEILSLGVAQTARRRGIARKLVGALFAAHADSGTIFIEVAADNEAARLLYAASGFVEAGRRAAYYARRNGRREDAIVMRKELKA